MLKPIMGLALFLAAAPAFAQAPAAPVAPAAPGGQEEMMKTMRLAAYNQLGVLEYCQGKGSIEAGTVDLQRRMITMLPPGPSDGMDAAEAVGKTGKVVFNGNEINLEDAAKRQNTTPEAMCKQMESMLKSAAAQLPK